MSKPPLPPLPTWPVPGSIWRHRKGGTYRVHGVGREEATLAPVVVYVASGSPDLWTRPLTEFLDGRFEWAGSGTP